MGVIGPCYRAHFTCIPLPTEVPMLAHSSHMSSSCACKTGAGPICRWPSVMLMGGAPSESPFVPLLRACKREPDSLSSSTPLQPLLTETPPLYRCEPLSPSVSVSHSVSVSLSLPLLLPPEFRTIGTVLASDLVIGTSLRADLARGSLPRVPFPARTSGSSSASFPLSRGALALTETPDAWAQGTSPPLATASPLPTPTPSTPHSPLRRFSAALSLALARPLTRSRSPSLSLSLKRSSTSSAAVGLLAT